MVLGFADEMTVMVNNFEDLEFMEETTKYLDLTQHNITNGHVCIKNMHSGKQKVFEKNGSTREEEVRSFQRGNTKTKRIKCCI